MATKITNGLDLLQTNLVQAVLHPVSGNHPTNPSEGQVWYRSDEGRFYIHTSGGSKGLAFSDDGATGVLETAFDANTILAANVDNTPAALTIPEQTLVGRITGGNIDALTAAEIRTLLGVEANAAADQNASEVPFTPAGDIAATDVQAAIQELDTEKTTEAYVDGKITDLIGGAPDLLNTLDELAQAINDDANFNTTIVASIAEKTKSVSADVGNGTDTSIAVTHSLGTRDIVVSVMEVSTNAMVIADWVANTTNQITLTFNTAPTTAQYRVTIIG